MKKTTITYILLLCAAMVSAQEKMPVIYPENRTLPAELLELKARRMPAEVVMKETEIQPAPESVIPHIRPVEIHNGVRRTPAAVEDKAGYLNPEGTLFCGMDEAGQGTFFSVGAIIGAWSCDLPCWTWINTATGNISSISYKTELSGAYPSYVEEELYHVDKDDNFCDSILARGGWQESYDMGAAGDQGYFWQNAVPLQTVNYKDGSTQLFALLNPNAVPSAGTKDTQGNLSVAAGGLPSSRTEDGLWPLTNAVNLTHEGVQFDLIAEKDGDNYVHYFFGSDSANTETGRTAPVKLITHYDKPQRVLYVKNITLALGADGGKRKISVNGLHLEVKDEAGNIIATSDANSKSNAKDMSYKDGKILTFSFQETSPYGEVLHEGFTIDEAFSIEITGFDAKDNWGIYSAKSSVHASKSSIVYADSKERAVDYDPFIMLNGIYPTLESYTGVSIYQSDKVAYPSYKDAMNYAYGTHGDTIKIAFRAADGAGKYSYIAECAAGEAKGQQEFDLYSTFKPYDENHYWLMNIERPAYVLMSADYELNIGPEDDPITLWDYYRMFILYIYATERPNVGDEIKIGKAGRNMVFQVIEVDDETALAPLFREKSADKMILNGQVIIRRGNQTYNVLGNQLNK